MTLEEAINLYERQAEELYKAIPCDGCTFDKCKEEHRQLAEWLRELKRNREILYGLSIYFQSLVVDAVINQRPMMFDMRDATKEERESVKRFIADSAKTTGVNFWSLIEEGKRR